MSQGKKLTVLLVEADTSLRRLITLGLQYRDMHVITASALTSLPALDIQQVDLLVFDINNGLHNHWELLETALQCLSDLPTVVLAWEDPHTAESSQQVTTLRPSQTKYLTKPFDARILHKAIDQLLYEHAAYKEACIARAESLLLASYSAHTAPSIWPAITAAGLLVACIGFMLHIAIAIIGVLIFVSGLLAWTIGTKPVTNSLAGSYPVS